MTKSKHRVLVVEKKRCVVHNVTASLNTTHPEIIAQSLSVCFDRDFFCCFKFSCLCLMESSNLVRQKNCLVMAAASAVQAARKLSNGEEKVCKCVLDCTQ